jgi:hypothetical protein
MKTFILFLLVAVTSCAHYYPVAVPADSDIDLWEVGQALGRSKRLVSVRPCQPADQVDFDISLPKPTECIVATTIETGDCPETYQYLLWKEKGKYITHTIALVTICPK